MKTLTIFFSALLLSFSTLAGGLPFKAEVAQKDLLHATVSYQNAEAPVQITVFNEDEGIVLTQRAESENYSLELDYLSMESGSYTVMIESAGQVVTEVLNIRKEEISVQLTLFNEEDGIIFKQVTTAADIETAIPVGDLESGDYLMLLEVAGNVVEEKHIHVE